MRLPQVRMVSQRVSVGGNYLWRVQEWRMKEHVKLRHSRPRHRLATDNHLWVSTRKVRTKETWWLHHMWSVQFISFLKATSRRKITCALVVMKAQVTTSTLSIANYVSVYILAKLSLEKKNLRELGVRSPSFLVAFQMTYCKSSKRLLVNVRTCEKS